MGRKNIKVPESLFLALRDDKPDSMSWPAYLETRCLGSDDNDTEELADEIRDLKAIVERTPEETAEIFARRFQ